MECEEKGKEKEEEEQEEEQDKEEDENRKGKARFEGSDSGWKDEFRDVSDDGQVGAISKKVLQLRMLVFILSVFWDIKLTIWLWQPFFPHFSLYSIAEVKKVMTCFGMVCNG